MGDFNWRPRGGLVQQYIDVFSPTTDAPQQFHVFVCLSAMATVIGRNVWIQDGAQRLHLNLFTLLLAPSSLYRKSTCIGHGLDLLRALEAPGGEVSRDGRLLYPQQFTPESFLEILQTQPTGMIGIDEFRAFLDGMRRDYNGGMKEMFMTLYDCRGLHRKIRSAEFRIDQPCVSMLSACATAWFTEATRQGEIRSGFYPRLLMVPAYKKDRYLTRGAPLDRHAYNCLLKHFNGLRSAKGEMVLPARLEGLLGDWSMQRQREIEGTEHEAELASFYTRLERVVMKLACLLQLGDDVRSREITALTLGDSLNLVGWLQDGLRHLFADEFTFSKDASDKQKLLRIITKQPSITRRDLLRLSHMTVKTFDPLLDTLKQEGSAEEKKRSDGKRGWFPSPASPAVTSEAVTQTDQYLRVSSL